MKPRIPAPPMVLLRYRPSTVVESEVPAIAHYLERKLGEWAAIGTSTITVWTSPRQEFDEQTPDIAVVVLAEWTPNLGVMIQDNNDWFSDGLKEVIQREDFTASVQVHLSPRDKTSHIKFGL